MPSLTELIRNFQRGNLSRDEFLASVDLALKDDRTDSTQFARVLTEEHTRFPLPAAVYAEVMDRIDSHMATQFDPGGDVATEAIGHAGRDALSEETRIEPDPSDRPAPGASDPSSGPGGNTAGTGSQSGLFTGGYVPSGPTKGVGDTLNGRFVLEECLGVGGMGTVYKALDLRKLEASDRKPYIAIKVLNLQFSGHPKSLIALQREARKAQQLAHRNIVTVYDFDRDGPTVFLTMEYLSGKSLNRVLRAPDFAGLPYAKAMPIVIGMGNALAYAHERGFVHCDFKPANVFLTDRGEVKVIDFGIARGFQQPTDDADQTVFDPGSLGGMTPAYASPEMFEHREPDPRDDIYALACVTYELLTGKHPYDRMASTEARARNMKPVPPSSLSRGQWKVLRQALSLDRATRTPTVTRFLAGLGAEPQRGGAHVPVIVGGAVALLAIATGVGFYLWRSPAAGDASNASTTSTASSASNGPSAPNPAAPAAAPSPPSNVPLKPEAVAQVLAATPCALLTASVDGNTLQVDGYAAEAALAGLRDKLLKVPGVKALKLDAQPLSQDKCDVVRTVAPYWSGNHKAGEQSGARLRTRGGTQLTEGTPLVLDITTPAHESYVYVDYFVADGKVAHLVPSPRVQGNQAPASYTATIGDGGDWVVSKPFGTELVVLLTTPAPLFGTRRPEFESRQDYLHALEKPLAQMASKYGRGQISADLVQIATRAK
ncbi:serine/threonine protein kinase [Cupriavidus pauculus]|uniref:serine/threonine protein kinase n=1 Tax=Cupriavidus pauculus TaxID=82633 RepID=UPI001246D1B3|nr:serine/threonine protein kinase [Cupriavidus pauculus]KAB0601890.1 protein kinase [Cupriavidus pauculus]MCM3608952.1 serine/threonine-protein kinase [Cupriavidus pauculus]UAL00326.1 protein kinase [Cupriavidus pauculus]